MNIIVAMTKRGVIGKRNTLPWHISDELKHFKKVTDGSVVIMGRKTFESIGKPLPNRINIIVSKSMTESPGVEVTSSFEEALNISSHYDKDVFVIGGATLFQQALPFAKKLYISYIKKEYEGDTYFPEISFDEWKEEKKEEYSDFDVVLYSRKK